MGANIFFNISRLASAKEVKVPPLNMASYFLVSSAASDPAEGERSGNRKMLSASPTTSGSLMRKSRAITMTVAVWGMRGGRKCRPSAVHRKAASIAAQARYFSSSKTVFHISGRCAAVLAFQTRRRPRSSTPHLSVGVTACLAGAGGGAGACIGKGCCSRGVWLEGWGWGGGGTRLVLITCICARVASSRSTLVRAVMTCWGSNVAALNKSRNGDTR